MSKEYILNFIRKGITDKLNRHGYSGVDANAYLHGEGRHALLVVELEATKPSGTQLKEVYVHPTMSMWSAEDIVNCFGGIAIRDKYIYEQYKSKRVTTLSGA